MANVISNYFTIKKPGSIGPLNGKKILASIVSDVHNGACLTGDFKSSKSSKIRSVASPKETKNVVESASLPYAIKSNGARPDIDIEHIVTSRKRKISIDKQEVKDANPPAKLIKLTTTANNAESGNPQSSCSNGKVLENAAQCKPTNTSTNTKHKLLNPGKIKELTHIKKRLNDIRNELTEPSITNPSKSSDKSTSQIDPSLNSRLALLKPEKIEELKRIKKRMGNIGNELAGPSGSSKAESSDKAESQTDSKIPAYQKLHALASKDALVLPFKFKFLAEGFRCLDTVVSLMYNRQEICPFAKAKPAVEDMMRRKFDIVNLGQIKTVFPTAYHFHHEKLHINRTFTSESQLTITPNMNCFSMDEESSNCIEEETKPYTIIKPKNDPSIKNKSIPANISKLQQIEKMKPSFLLARRDVFHSQLIKIMKRFHKDFLLTLNPPIVLKTNQSLMRWHPKFAVNSIPDIVPSELPKPAETQLCSSAIDVLHKIKGLYSKKMDDALESVSSKSDPVQNEINVTQPSSSIQVASAPIKGIPLALLGKIRAKEAAKIKADMTRQPEDDFRLQMMSRLPDMARILRNLFISEKKAAVSISDASTKICESYCGSVSSVDTEKHLYLLKELAPDWLSILNIRADIYLKLNKTMCFSDVLSKIESARKLATLA